jgi:glutathione S-transferase
VNADAVEDNTMRALGLYEERLTGRKWIALDRPTVADVAPYPALAQCGDGDVSLAEYPAIRAWMARMEALPGFVGILAEGVTRRPQTLPPPHADTKAGHKHQGEISG